MLISVLELAISQIQLSHCELSSAVSHKPDPIPDCFCKLGKGLAHETIVLAHFSNNISVLK